MNATPQTTHAAKAANRINGFPVYVHQGKEISEAEAFRISAPRRLNGPHHEAKWAQRILGTDMTASERKAALTAH